MRKRKIETHGGRKKGDREKKGESMTLYIVHIHIYS